MTHATDTALRLQASRSYYAVSYVSLFLLLVISFNASAAFQPDGTGLVSMEAEHFTEQRAQGDHDWQREVRPTSGFSGEGTLRALPEDKISIDMNYAASSPRLDYQIEFARSGTHTIWVRGRGPGGGSNSVHAGLNGEELASAAGISVPASSSYGWNSGSFEVDNTGVHIVNVWMRESGTVIDKLIVTPDVSFTPTGTGPAESPVVAVERNTPPVLATIGNKSGKEEQPLSFTVTANDPDGVSSLSVSGLPSGASFNTSTGAFNWTPVTGAAAGSPYMLTFTVTDAADASLTDRETIRITISTTGGSDGGTNQPPTPVQGCSTIPQAGTLTGMLRAIDSDNNVNELLFSLDPNTPNFAGPIMTAYGAEVSLTDTTTGAFVYTSNVSGPRGVDTFEFRVDDPEGFSLSEETVIINPAIMPLGDSITLGTIDGKDPSANRVGYRRKLFNDLTGNGFQVNFVGSLRNGQSASPAIRDPDHEGWGGFKARQIAHGKTSGGIIVFPGVYGALNMNPADVVLLHIGTNNINQDVPASTAMDIEEILDEIDRWEASNGGNPVAVFLAQIIGRSTAQCDLEGCANPRVTALNERIAQIVASRAGNGDDIVLVDQYSALNYPEDMAPQGADGRQLIHPDQNGYEKMARPWLTAIQASGKLPKCP